MHSAGKLELSYFGNVYLIFSQYSVAMSTSIALPLLNTHL
jgi:hypothetical protein